MYRYHRFVAALLLALALLAGCDVNSTPATPSPLPTAGAIPEPTAGAIPEPTAGAPPSDATPNNVAYPSPGYVPPATPQQ